MEVSFGNKKRLMRFDDAGYQGGSQYILNYNADVYIDGKKVPGTVVDIYFSMGNYVVAGLSEGEWNLEIKSTEYDIVQSHMVSLLDKYNYTDYKIFRIKGKAK